MDAIICSWPIWSLRDNLWSLELYRPGARRRRPLSIQLNLAGQRFQSVHYTLDGLENTDFNYGTYLVQPSLDALQEFNVETGTLQR